MSVIAEFSVPASQFVLGKALLEAPDLEVEIERMIPTGDAVIPYFWVVGEGREQFEAVLAREPELSGFEAVDEIDDRTLYRIEWDPTVDTFVQTIVIHDGVLQRATGDEESWEFQLRFPDSHALSEFHTACREAEIDVSVESLYNPIEPTTMEKPTMTEAQLALIERAYDEGYFDVPRGITLVELAGELGISDQSVNERLRRGLSTLIATTLKSDHPKYDDDDD